jgi:hypothetical protein
MNFDEKRSGPNNETEQRTRARGTNPQTTTRAKRPYISAAPGGASLSHLHNIPPSSCYANDANEGDATAAVLSLPIRKKFRSDNVERVCFQSCSIAARFPTILAHHLSDHDQVSSLRLIYYSKLSKLSPALFVTNSWATLLNFLVL